MFGYFEGWSPIEGAYFSFITLSTIGFGDFVPGSSGVGAIGVSRSLKGSFHCVIAIFPASYYPFSKLFLINYNIYISINYAVCGGNLFC